MKRTNGKRTKKKKNKKVLDKKILTRISKLKKISGKGGLSYSKEELKDRYDNLSMKCGFNNADIAKDVAQISGIDPVNKECKESLVVLWNHFYDMELLHKEIDYLETYLSEGIESELNLRDCH